MLLFENAYVRDKKTLKEAYAYFFFRRPLSIVGEVLLALAFLANLALLIFDGSYNINIWITGVVLAGFWFFLYIRTVKMASDRDRQSNAEAAQTRMKATDDHMELYFPSGKMTEVRYGRIRTAYHTRNLILLRSNKNVLFILRKDAFQVGKAEEFLPFLQEKGVPVK